MFWQLLPGQSECDRYCGTENLLNLGNKQMGHTVNCISQRFFKSAANVDPQQEQPLLPADKRASTARSENCILITVAEDLDYDDLASYISISMSNKNSKPLVLGLRGNTYKTSSKFVDPLPPFPHLTLIDYIKSMETPLLLLLLGCPLPPSPFSHCGRLLGIAPDVNAG